jgi:alkylhydroperoxidase/carboxymuconolactone decarboxylase family protein YurZ
LDKKTEELTYSAVLAALRLKSGAPLHAQLAKEVGAPRAQVVSSVLAGLPAAGQGATQVLPTAIATHGAG